MEARDVVVAQVLRLLHRRQARAMEDLVGVGVADAGEDARVGERALERVVLGGEHRAERLERRAHHLDSAAIVRSKRVLAFDQVERGPLLGARLAQDERARREVEGGEPDLPRQLGARFLPGEATGDHQVDHQVQVAVEVDHDALAEPPHPGDGAVVGLA